MREITASITFVSLCLQNLYMYVSLSFCLILQMCILLTLTLIGLKLADKETSCLLVLLMEVHVSIIYLFLVF